MKTNLIALAALTTLLSSCSNSLLYSPSLHLPVKPLGKSQLDVQAAAEVLPETRPDKVRAETTLGGSMMLGYGLSHGTSLYAKGWTDFGGRGIHGRRSGLSLHSVSTVARLGTRTSVLLIPRVGLALDGKYRGGYGAALTGLINYRPTEALGLYGGAGFLFGAYDFEQHEINNESRLASGYVVCGHLGFAVRIGNQLRLNTEVSTLYQVNSFENATHVIVAPSIGIGYVLSALKKKQVSQ